MKNKEKVMFSLRLGAKNRLVSMDLAKAEKDVLRWYVLKNGKLAPKQVSEAKRTMRLK